MLALAFGELTTSHIHHYLFLPHRSIFIRDVGLYVVSVHAHGLISTILFAVMFR